MKEDKTKYLHDFEINLRELHKNYKSLENDHNELTSQQKLESDIEKKLREKENMRKECEQVDARHRMILDDYMKYKKQY